MDYSRSFNLESIAQNTLIAYGFTPFFSAHILKEARRVQPIHFKKSSDIVDLRHLLWSSIDNDDSKDLDQMEYCERLNHGQIAVKVAVADVDAYVHRGGHIDRHASHNATSVYTGIKVFPMLPTELSNDITSLVEQQDRLALVVEFTVKRDGQIVPGNVYRAWVANKAKLIYENVGDWLEGKDPHPDWLTDDVLERQLKLQDEAAARLGAYLQSQGALELETIEAKPIVDNGRVIDLIVPAYNRARAIIEQFMIAANQTMVHFLHKHQIPVIQRIVRTPERWNRICDITSDYGYTLPAQPDAAALNGFLLKQKRKDPKTFPDLSLTIIKLMGPGEYAFALPGKAYFGHFGLAITHYTHSTAPNRRYVDLIIQRLVKAVLAKESIPYTKRELIEIAAWCSERDQASKKVERFMRKVAACMLLGGLVGETFEAIITGASSKGTYARLFDPPAEGRVIQGIADLDVGQKVLVRLIHLDPLEGHIDLATVRILR